MPSANFIGAGLHLESLTLLGTNILRVKFAQDPLAVNSAGAHDGLNLANYLLTGPAYGYFSGSAPVLTDPQSIDLTLGMPLPAGTYTLTVVNIETAEGNQLEAPTSLDFMASGAIPQDPVSGGGTNDDALDILKKHMGGGLPLDDAGWDSFLGAIAKGDEFIFDTAAQAFYQRFVATAGGIYLDYLGAAEGVTRPPNLGMSDDLYRQLVTRLKTGKLTEESFLRLLEIFYGIDAVHGQVTTANPEPFALADGVSVSLLIDERFPALITFSDDDFEVPGAGKAVEVAAAITRSFILQGIDAYAVPHQDAVSGLNKVRVYSGGYGIRSTVRCEGGPAQNVLLFPTLRVLADPAATWTVIPVAGDPGTFRFTTAGATTVDLTQVVDGDYVNVYGTQFAPGNRGTFTITNVQVYYNASVLTQAFDIQNGRGVSQSVSIQNPTDLAIFTPTKASSFASAGRAVQVSSGIDSVDVVIPATTQAVQRSIGKAAYLQTPLTLIPSRVERLGDGTVKLSVASHGITASAPAFVDGVAYNGTPAAINAGVPGASGATGTSPSTLGAGPLVLRNLDMAGATNRHMVVLNNDSILIAGGTTGSGVSAQAQVMTLSAASPAADTSIPYGYNYLPATPITWTGRDLNAKAKTLTLGPNTGKVLFIGGATAASSAGTYTNSTDLFDPSASTFASGPTMAAARGQFAAERVLANGNIFVSGGKATASSTTSLIGAEVYVVSSNSWTTVASMLSSRDNHTLTSLPNGDILAAGGSSGTTFPAPQCEIYSVTGNSWSDAGDMCIPRKGHTAVALPDGRIMVLGGVTVVPGDARVPASYPEFYDSSRGRWQLAGSAPFSMTKPKVTLDTDNTRLVVYDPGTNQLGYYDYVTNRWTMGTAAPSNGGQSGSAWHPPTSLMILAGGNSTTPNSQVELIATHSLSTSAVGLSSGQMNGEVELLVLDGNTLAYQTEPGFYYVSSNADKSIVVTRATAPARKFIGPYTFDTKNGVAVTAIASEATMAYAKGGQYATLQVADASTFPDKPGYVCVGFGYEYQVSPIPYLGVLDPTHLILDFSFKFTAATPVGASVTLLTTKGAFVPTATFAAACGSFYLTESAAGRLAAQSAIAAAQAAGVTVNVTVTYPGDRGLGGEGYPDFGNYKLSDIVSVFAGDDIDSDVAAAEVA